MNEAAAQELLSEVVGELTTLPTEVLPEFSKDGRTNPPDLQTLQGLVLMERGLSATVAARMLSIGESTLRAARRRKWYRDWCTARAEADLSRLTLDAVDTLRSIVKYGQSERTRFEAARFVIEHRIAKVEGTSEDGKQQKQAMSVNVTINHDQKATPKTVPNAVLIDAEATVRAPTKEA